MATAETRRWIEAAKVLLRDPSANVTCPKCETMSLTVLDVPWPNRSGKIDRYMHCEGCKARNVMTGNFKS